MCQDTGHWSRVRLECGGVVGVAGGGAGGGAQDPGNVFYVTGTQQQPDTGARGSSVRRESVRLPHCEYNLHDSTSQWRFWSLQFLFNFYWNILGKTDKRSQKRTDNCVKSVLKLGWEKH